MTIKDAAKEIIKTRHETHGGFVDATSMTQELLGVMMKHPNYARMNAMQAECLHMICHKMSRITCGDPDFHDHWLDISGYSMGCHDNIPILGMKK